MKVLDIVKTLHVMSNTTFSKGYVSYFKGQLMEPLIYWEEQSSQCSQRLDQWPRGIWVLNKRGRHILISFTPSPPTHEWLTSWIARVAELISRSGGRRGAEADSSPKLAGCQSWFAGTLTPMLGRRALLQWHFGRIPFHKELPAPTRRTGLLLPDALNSWALQMERCVCQGVHI